MTLRGILLFTSVLLASTVAAAQEVALVPQVVDATGSALAAAPQQAEVAAPAAASRVADAAAGVELQLATPLPPSQAGLPAGVCPVISDYLYQQCQQDPADAMCAPVAVTQ